MVKRIVMSVIGLLSVGSDDDYQTSAVVGVYWQARDEESGVEHCDWAIGM